MGIVKGNRSDSFLLTTLVAGAATAGNHDLSAMGTKLVALFATLSTLARLRSPPNPAASEVLVWNGDCMISGPWDQGAS